MAKIEKLSKLNPAFVNNVSKDEHKKALCATGLSIGQPF